tara:strand:- start:8572 stop:8835 length:264 start_codon:yes stop_codon:yes gene_type:complete
MQTEQTLIDLGFKRHPKWDTETKNHIGKATDVTPHYKMIGPKAVWRAKPEVNNGIPYVIMGMVVSESGLVDRWRDCCSEGSVERKIK